MTAKRRRRTPAAHRAPAPGPSTALVGRGGLKLRAALDLFSLGSAVEGASAVDVGASTGGFTQVLLEAGARAVTAVEGGHDQLHERLRSDARVTNLERTDWKTLSLDQAAGPFDFFTVDVSFVAARSMLRGLAFRLRDGAQGVVLVKPQFELPDSAVRGGDVSAPALRQRALDRFSDKANRLGFEMRAHADSPVAGGEGTIEILAHLRFRGRPETLPRPGQKREPARSGQAGPSGKGKTRGGAARALALDPKLRWFAVVAPGAEEVAAREATQALPDATVNAVAGGIDIEGSLGAGLSANLELRIPTRVLLRLGEVRAREFGKLRHLVARLPWERFLPPDAPVRISASASRCRLYHTGGIDENVRAAIGDRLGVIPEKAPADAGAPLVLVRGSEDRFMISIDSSGERLHRRGWRIDPHEAPLRETLAACLLALAGWQPSQPLVDPMCGAGTIPIEACSAALGFSPGADRTFAFESWPAFDAAARETWGALRAAAAERRRTELAAPIHASDREAAAIDATRANAARAGVNRWLRITEESLADVHPPAGGPGVFLANPPYGRRLGSIRSLPSLYRQVGQVLRQRFHGWRAGVVVPDARLASAFQLPVVASHRVAHGGLGVTLLLFSP